MKNNNSIKTVVAVGIGAALFFVLGRFVAIPSPVPNTNISLQYAVLALLAGSRGTYRIYRSYSDRPFLGRNSMVELGDHFRFRRRNRRSLCQKAECTGGRLRQRKGYSFRHFQYCSTCDRMDRCCPCTGYSYLRRTC